MWDLLIYEAEIEPTLQNNLPQIKEKACLPAYVCVCACAFMRMSECVGRSMIAGRKQWLGAARKRPVRQISTLTRGTQFLWIRYLNSTKIGLKMFTVFSIYLLSMVLKKYKRVIQLLFTFFFLGHFKRSAPNFGLSSRLAPSRASHKIRARS